MPGCDVQHFVNESQNLPAVSHQFSLPAPAPSRRASRASETNSPSGMTNGRLAHLNRLRFSSFFALISVWRNFRK